MQGVGLAMPVISHKARNILGVRLRYMSPFSCLLQTLVELWDLKHVSHKLLRSWSSPRSMINQKISMYYPFQWSVPSFRDNEKLLKKKKPLTCIIPWIISATYVTYGFSIQHGMLTICQAVCPTPTYQFISQKRHIKNNACEFLSGARVGWVETGICGREWDPSETSGSTPGSGTSGLFWITCSVIWVQLGLPPLKLEWLSRRNKYGSGSPV